MNVFDRFSTNQRSLLSGVVGFLFYGAWAFGVNFSYGALVATKAACVQGGYSFVLTFVMTLLMEWVYRFSNNFLESKSLLVTISALVTCTIVFSGSWLVNVIAGTPEIFKTVILGYIVGGIYTLIYLMKLARS